jgi:transposase InsO family protein
MVNTMDNKTKTLQYLNIPKSSFYYKSLKEEKDTILKNEIEIVIKNNPSYGHKRVALSLGLNRKQIRRIMKKFSIKPSRRRKTPSKSIGKEKYQASPNLLISLFPLYQNHIWITDFTYLKWRGGWVYVCTIIDLFTREVVGLSIKTNHTALLVSEAILNALTSNEIPTVIHSDQGSEYKSKLFRSILTDYKILQSMSKKGSPWQNGYQESFFSNWKVDIGDVNRFNSLGELTAELYKSIYYYNNLRIHTSLKMSPRQFIEKFAKKKEVEYNTNTKILVV